MTSYTITITPEDGGGAQTTVRVEVDRTVTRITEISVRSGNGRSVSPDLLAAMDLELLLRAVNPGSVQAAVQRQAPEPRRAAKRAAQSATVRTRAASRPRANVAREKREAAATSDGRAYRRMPDDLLESFERIGSVTALAAHYGVPRHTAQGWMNRARQVKG